MRETGRWILGVGEEREWGEGDEEREMGERYLCRGRCGVGDGDREMGRRIWGLEDVNR